MRKLFLFIILLLVASKSFADSEISLFNSKGDAVAYIAVYDELTIYLWNGEPVAYIDNQNVYGFNGRHLGWFSDGIIIDHYGDSPCVMKNRYPGYTNYESYKGYKNYKPFKSYQEYAPYKPFISNMFSTIPCSFFLLMGTQ